VVKEATMMEETGDFQLHEEYKVVLKQIKTKIRHRSREHTR